MKFSEYTVKSVEEIFGSLESSDKGLSDREAELRLKIHGFNDIRVRETGLFDIFIRQFKSPFFYLLFIAAVLAYIVRGGGEKTDSIVILVFILVNVILGFLQEARADRTVAHLKKYFPEKIRVLRGDAKKIIDKKFLVPGDIVLLEAGDVAPADLRILKTENLLVDESVLTGESVPVAKFSQSLSEEAKEIFEAKNIIFAGTALVSGKIEGIVMDTGKNTVFGEITKLVSKAKRPSAYEKSLLQFSKIVLRIVVSTIVLVFLADLVINHNRTNPAEFLIFSIALIVSILPEALPLIVTFALSNGAMSMAREKVVVKRLSAIEDLGDIEILCSDKTGTLTEGKLRLEKIFSPDQDKCLLYSLLTSAFIKEEIDSSINPFDLAQFEKASATIRQSLQEFKEIADIPFDPFRMRSTALLTDKNGRKILIVKGAPEIVLEMSSRFEGDLSKDSVEKEVQKEGRAGRRTLAVAFKEVDFEQFTEQDEKNLTFLGFSTFADPLKKTAKESISLAQAMGLEIKILTGDSKEVAAAIAQEVNLIESENEVISGKELNALSEDDFARACADFTVFARVSPQTKLRIVQILQKKAGVGFLGEGVNDTPALKIADVGIVVKDAADVSREAADVVLLEKDLRVIINGIRDGRRIFSNINKYIKCAVASNSGNFYSIAVISVFIPLLLKTYFLPMLPIQILLGNLLSDFPLISIATDSIDARELKKPKMHHLKESIPLIIFLALVSTIFDFIFFSIFYKAQPGLIQTLWYIESILTEIMLIFIIRTRHFFLRAKRPSIALMFFTLFDGILIVALPYTNWGQQFFHFVPPSWAFLKIVFFLLIGYFAVSEIVKLLYYRRHPARA